MEPSRQDLEALINEKYHGNKGAPGLAEDMLRLSEGEPLAYIIGNIPFLGLIIHLDSKPLIPRPETEWWTEELIKNIQAKNSTIYGTATHQNNVIKHTSEPIRILDLCAGSGAIGLAVVKHCPNARVSFGELVPEHAATIRKNADANGLDASRTDIRIGDLFAPFKEERYDIIATNPPYIPNTRHLDASVASYEPKEALFSGTDGLTLIRKVIAEAPHHLTQGGELWMECDIANSTEAAKLAAKTFTNVEIRTDQYGRERIIVAHL